MPDGTHASDIFRLIPSPCAFEAPFLSNNKFTFVSGNEECYSQGKLGFNRVEEKPDGSYKTYFGPCYHHLGVVYQADDAGLESAFNFRMACARMPTVKGYSDVGGYHQFLLLQHEYFFTTDDELRLFQSEFEHYLSEWFLEIGDLDVLLCIYAHQPHSKRGLRIRAYQNIISNGDLFHKTFNRAVTGKMKKAEIAKFLKNTRLINDLTTEGSLLAGFVVDEMKKAMASYTANHWFQFIKSPNLDDLKTVFARLMDPADQMYFPFFSDDSCVAIRCSDGIYFANVDISSCDASHGHGVFHLLRKLSRADSRLFRYVDGAIKQCEMALTLRNADNSQKVKLQPSMPTLYSGSTLTTIINNFANIAIACAIKGRLRPDITMAECPDLVRTAAAAAGYIVTVASADSYHKLQFLKHSPCRALCGTIVPVLNHGVMLRSSGSCWGDLPTYRKTHGRISLEERMRLYNISQTQCYKNVPTTSYLAALRQKYHSDKTVFRPSQAHHYIVDNITSDYSCYIIPDSELAIRYGVQDYDIEELSHTLEGSTMSSTVASRAILREDYGLC